MVTLSLDWKGDLAFENVPGSPAIVLHSSTPGVTSPPQALAYAVMACMAMDVVHVIQKGRHELHALRIRFDGERAAEHPRRYVSMTLHFDVTAAVAPHVVERAIELSRTKYCSVWNTIRPDVTLTTSFAIAPPPRQEQPDGRPEP
jgi:putative redox protein